MTLHSAKGLEFPVVFMPGMEEGIFPSPISINEENEEEERRLCYVGITRAMEELHLLHTTMRTLYGNTHHNNISRFIEEVPENLIDMEDEYNRKEEVKRLRLDTENTKKEEFEIENIKSGSKVVHPKFGLGTVVGVAGNNVTITFEKCGIKNIDPSYINLEVLKEV